VQAVAAQELKLAVRVREALVAAEMGHQGTLVLRAQEQPIRVLAAVAAEIVM
tara:strand:- start:32 stop:187 length:156 start_codon:yes stop_codon:yes gene_type:complete